MGELFWFDRDTHQITLKTELLLLPMAGHINLLKRAKL